MANSCRFWSLLGTQLIKLSVSPMRPPYPSKRCIQFKVYYSYLFTNYVSYIRKPLKMCWGTGGMPNRKMGEYIREHKVEQLAPGPPIVLVTQR